MDRIGAYTEMLEKLDDGFEALYDRVRTEIVTNKSAYQTEIVQMQNYIQPVVTK